MALAVGGRSKLLEVDLRQRVPRFWTFGWLTSVSTADSVTA
jgi:hypothetical protein